MKVAVIGIGGTGSAAARFLARAGHEVVGFEQFAVGHTRGSSHGESRIIRYTYSDELYTQLMGEAYPLWQELQLEAGEELLVRTGGLFFGGRFSSLLASARAALDQSSVPYEWLAAAEAVRRFPALRLADTEAALYQPDMGYLRATACVLANIRLANARGADIREETPVREVAQTGSQVQVTTEAGETSVFDRALVTAGPWLGQFFAGLRLRVTRQQVVYLKPQAGTECNFEADKLPVWIDADTNMYGFPTDGRVEGVKLASHHQGEDADPNGARRPPDSSYQEQMGDYAAARFVGLTRQLTHAETCLYTNTPNEDFLLDTVPGQPHVWLVSGCSGHGFKFTVLLGKIAAEAATRGVTPPYLPRFALRQFRPPRFGT